MCGITGFYQNRKLADKSVLKKMNDRITHRGPDDEGFFFNGKAGLAARRLSIIDLKTGHQPLSSYSGKCHITYNGEVYNFAELRKDLISMGYKFRTQTDTEVIVNLYEEFGTDFVTRLRGMFAIGIYDSRKERLILARDHTGIKPLYYTFLPGKECLVFGSEIKAILEYPDIKREVSRDALDFFLTLEYIPAPFSIFRGIKKLRPGHVLVYENNRIKTSKYWEVKKRDIPKTISEQKEVFHSLLEESVKMRMISDVPLGAFLSGGIDSSSIVSVMSKLSKDPIKTFSIGFEEKSYSELQYSEVISKKFGTDHYTKNLSPDIEKLVLFLSDFLDEPLGDFSNFPTYLVSKTAREKVTVVLSGDGGDEIFGGYEHYIAQKIAGLIDKFPLRMMHKALSRMTWLFPPSELKKGFVNRIKRFSEGLENDYRNRHFRWMIFLSDLQKSNLYSDRMLKEEYNSELFSRDPISEYFNLSENFKGINRDLYLDLKTYLVDNILVKVDRMSMATSLEARVPLLDHKMVEFAFSLPPGLKLKGKTTKYFFKEAMRGILPDSIIDRRKEGFSIPIKNWLKKDLKDLMLEYLSEKRVKEGDFFNYKYVEKMINEHLNNRQNHAHRLWSLILFNIWREKFLK